MNNDVIANKLLRVAKTLVSSNKNDIITFPLLNKMKRVSVDLNESIYTDDMVWGHEIFSVETILSNGEKLKDTITIYVYGFEGKPKEKAVWLVAVDEIEKRKHIQFCRDIRFALNSSSGLKGYFDPDRIYDGAFDHLDEDDQDKIARHIQLCQDKACEIAKKLANNL